MAQIGHWGNNMRMTRLISLVALVLFLGASTAQAQGHANVFVGSNFMGDAGRSLNEALNNGSRLTWGADVGGMTKGIFGAELDVAYSRKFFGDDPRLGTNYVFTLMPSLIVGVPVGGERGPGIQPYGTVGFGLIRRDLTVDRVEAFKDNNLGYSIGFGVNGYATTNVGIRADYRYFRNVTADESNNLVGIDFDRGTFSYSRASVGALFRF
jgi:opacity protein-like surface antigen